MTFSLTITVWFRNNYHKLQQRVSEYYADRFSILHFRCLSQMSDKTEMSMHDFCSVQSAFSTCPRTFFTKTLQSVGDTAFSSIWWGGAKSDN